MQLPHGRAAYVRFGFIAAVLLGANGPAHSAFLRVNPGGGADYLTVAAAMTAAAFDDTVAVVSGLHTVSNVQFTNGVQLLGGWDASFSSRNPGTSHLRASGGGRLLLFTTGQVAKSLVDGFEISGASQSAIFVRSSSPTIRNNEFHDNTSQEGAGIDCESGAAPLIELNHFHHNHAAYGGAIESHFGSNTSPVIRRNLIEYNTSVHAGGGLSANNGFALVENNVVRFNETDGTGGGIHVWHAGGGTITVRGNLVIYNSAPEGGGIGITGGHPIIENNTVWANSAPAGGALYQEESTVPDPGTTVVRRNILGGSTTGSGVYVTGDFAMDLSCNCVFGNAGGTYFGVPAGSTDIDADPRFCDLVDYLIASSSPCAPAHAPACGLIGAFDVGCGTVSLEAVSWAHIKSAFRSMDGAAPAAASVPGGETK